MSNKRKSRPCYLDIKDILKFDSSLHYFSSCPACKELISEHKDEDFRRQQRAKTSARQREIDDDAKVLVQGGDECSDTNRPKKKKLNGPIPAAEAAILVQQVFIFYNKLACHILFSHVCLCHLITPLLIL
jgi:hypothetical protein